MLEDINIQEYTDYRKSENVSVEINENEINTSKIFSQIKAKSTKNIFKLCYVVVRTPWNSELHGTLFHLFQTFQRYKFQFYFYSRARRRSGTGTEVAGMLVANGMDLAAVIMTMEGTTLVSSIMADSAAIGSIITRTGQSTLNRTCK